MNNFLKVLIHTNSENEVAQVHGAFVNLKKSFKKLIAQRITTHGTGILTMSSQLMMEAVGNSNCKYTS